MLYIYIYPYIYIYIYLYMYMIPNQYLILISTLYFAVLALDSKIQSKFGNKVEQIRSGGPSGGFKNDFLRSGGP